MTTIERNKEAPSNSETSIVGAALASALAPGFVLGLAFAFTEQSHSIEALILAPVLSIAGGIVGAPFALLLFTPTILFLRKFYRLNWLSTTTVGYLSVFVIGVGHCVIENTVSTGIGNDALFAICGGIAGFCFWMMVGDLEKDES